MQCFRRFISIFFSLLAFLAILSGCSENVTLFGPSEDPAAYSIDTISDGTILDEEGSIHFSLQVIDTEGTLIPDSAEMEVVDAYGTVVIAGGFIDLGTDPEEPRILFLDNLEDGVYTLQLRLLNGLEIIDTLDRQFFILTDRFGIYETLVYPPTVEPDSLAIARAELFGEETYNPYVRWRIDDELVAEGYWYDGAETVRFDTPEEDGAFYLDLDLFPYGPQEGVDVARTAPVTHHGSVYVSSERTLNPGELGPNDEFVDLFHFAGNLRNAAPNWVNSGEARMTGEEQVLIDREVFGYYLDGTTAIELDRSIVPYDGQAIMAELVILPFLIAGEETFFTSQTESGEQFLIGVDENGKLLFSYFDAAGGQLDVPILRFFDDENETLRLSILTTALEEAYIVTVLDNGYPTVPISIPRIPPDPEDETDTEDRVTAQPGITEIGGENGVYGIIDEFGISVMEPEVVLQEVRTRYHTALLNEYGSDLILSDAIVDVPAEDRVVYVIDETGSTGARFTFELADTQFPVAVDLSTDDFSTRSYAFEEDDVPVIEMDLPADSLALEVMISASESDVTILNLSAVRKPTE